MEYVKHCKHCRKAFTTKRKDKQFDTAACKTKHFRLLSGFDLIAELVPEEEVKKKYYTVQDDHCAIYLQWFHDSGTDYDKATKKGERVADVYASKDCSIDFKKRFKNNKHPTRVAK